MGERLDWIWVVLDGTGAGTGGAGGGRRYSHPGLRVWRAHHATGHGGCHVEEPVRASVMFLE